MNFITAGAVAENVRDAIERLHIARADLGQAGRHADAREIASAIAVLDRVRARMHDEIRKSGMVKP